MKKVKCKHIVLAAILAGSLGLTSCKKNDNPPPAPAQEQQHFVFICHVDQKSGYLGTFSDLTPKAVDNKNTYEFGFGTYPFVRGNTVLIAEGVWGDKIHKFTRNEKGYLVKGEVMTFGQDSRPGEISFLNDEVAYVSLSQRGKIGIFSPKTMQQTGEIDLSAYATNDNNPDPGCNIIRDGKLYVALNQRNSTHTSWPGTGAEVAVIDLNTKEIKVTKDDRTGAVGLFRHSETFMDENGDIYFYSSGSNINKAEKEGLLRIRKGKDEWDTEYLFSLSATPIQGMDVKGQYMIKFFYAGNGIVYSCLKITDTEFGVLKKEFQAVKINIWDKTIEKLDLPLTDSNGSFAITRYKDFIVFGMACNNGTGYYTYNTKTGECSQTPPVTSVGVPSSIIAFE